MNSHTSDGMASDFKQRPGSGKSSWNWRATGLFYPETEDWALGRSADTAETGQANSANSVQTSATQRLS